MIHDLTYQYGFTEISGNFQDNNFGNRGAEGDGVKAIVQLSTGINNAYFISPPDGKSGMISNVYFQYDITT